jgi:hypothetical protein
MSDPHDAKQPKDDRQYNSSPEEKTDIDELDVRSEDAEKVKGGRMEDPCAGGQLRKK